METADLAQTIQDTANARGVDKQNMDISPPGPPPPSADMDESGANLPEWGNAGLARRLAQIHITCGPVALPSWRNEIPV
eukprot:1000766-Lingulodinium_polyedra.AAC.1